MKHRVFSSTLLLLLACSRTHFVPASGPSSAGPQETFDCAKRQLAALGYKQSSVDVSEHRITGRKIDSKARRANTQFRRVIHQLEIDVDPASEVQARIGVKGRTFAEYATHRGPTEEEEGASDEVVKDTQQLLQRCRS